MHLGGLSVSILAHVEGIKSMEQRAKSVQILISAQPARILVLVDCLVSSEILFFPLYGLWYLLASLAITLCIQLHLRLRLTSRSNFT